MSKEDYDGLVVKAAEYWRIDANLIRAIITVESSWDNWAARFEPSCAYSNNVSDYARKNMLSYDTEQQHQHTSWGLMQVLGVVARDLGFTDKITMLCDPQIGIFYGCKKIKQLMSRYPDEADIVAAYNAGSAKKTPGGMFENQSYVDKIHSVLTILRKLQ